MKKIAFLFALVLLACQPEDSTTIRVLQDDGYTDIELLGPNGWACNHGEARSESFRARRGDRVVEGTVCCSGYYFGDCTIRH